MKILITGAAGFIGSAVVDEMLSEGHEVVGIDNINSYNDTALKYARLAKAGIRQDEIREDRIVQSVTGTAYRFAKVDITDRVGLARLFASERFDAVANFAAQAGVRYSLENPYAYVSSNVVGFLNLLEDCRQYGVDKLVFASSSSVYGAGLQTPYRESLVTDTPVSLYAATKKSDELMAYAYSRLFGIKATGLRFFTVYGPWGRPDMAPYIFMKAITEGRLIHVFNHGRMSRDFTFISDTVAGVKAAMGHTPVGEVPFAVYNVGNSSPVSLLDFIRSLENVTGRKADMRMEGMQAGDMQCTYTNISLISEECGYSPKVGLDEGIARFYEWFKAYNGNGLFSERRSLGFQKAVFRKLKGHLLQAKRRPFAKPFFARVYMSDNQ